MICSYCPNIVELPNSILKDLKVLDCSSTNIVKIPYINGLKELYCWSCPNVTEIPVIDSLDILSFAYCPKITKLVKIKNLKKLYIHNCPIVEIPEDEYGIRWTTKVCVNPIKN